MAGQRPLKPLILVRIQTGHNITLSQVNSQKKLSSQSFFLLLISVNLKETFLVGPKRERENPKKMKEI